MWRVSPFLIIRGKRTRTEQQRGQQVRFHRTVPVVPYVGDIVSADGKSWREVKADGLIIDYRDVTFNGYLSTFGAPARLDRDGEYIEFGAFDETLKTFVQNPVILTDHTNRVESAVGRFESVTVDSRGLKVVGRLSNAPDVASVRFKVAEGILRGLSVGGMLVYGENGMQITKVYLYEGSLTPIPANQEALISNQ